MIFLGEYGHTTEVRVRSTEWTVAVGSSALRDSMVLEKMVQGSPGNCENWQELI